jgi:adenosylcobinamide-GDP ribazoletransferase
MIHNILVALGYLTIIPTRARIKDESNLRDSVSFFPVIGLFIGSLLVIVDCIGAFIFPPLPKSLSTIGVLVLFTGALHLDGFADTVDGLAGGWGREEILRIMRNSNIGVMGIVGVYLLLSSKILLLYELLPPLRFKTLLLMPAFGRYALTLSSYLSKSARDDGKGRPFITGTGRRQLLASTSFLIMGGFSLFGVKTLLLLSIVGVLTIGIVSFMNHKIGGMTGDTLGFTCEVTEIAILAGVVAMRNLLT